MTHRRTFEKQCLICIVVLAALGKVQGDNNCSLNLVTGPNGVPDDHLSATSVLNNDTRYLPKYGRLFSGNSWIANIDPNLYIQVSFNKEKIILAVKTQGRSSWVHWVQSYAVSYSLDNEIWTFVKDNDIERIFQANNDQHTVVTNVLPEVVIVKHFRIHPRMCYGPCSLRFELIGCDVPEKKKFWKVHPIFISDFRDSLWNKSASDLGQCATNCFNHSTCQSFVFNRNDGKCMGFKQEYLNGYRLDVLQGNLYYLDIASLNNYTMYLNETGYTDAGNVIYKIYTDMADIISARSVCQSDNTHLLMVRNLPVLSTLQKDMASMELFVDGSQVNGKWVYHNNVEIPTNVWTNREPSSSNGNCVVVTKTGLKIESCLTNHNFICGF